MDDRFGLVPGLLVFQRRHAVGDDPAAGVRQRHIDQSQSVNLYITTDYSFRQVLNLYVLAFEQGVKTIYYIRSKSLEVSECEACSS